MSGGHDEACNRRPLSPTITAMTQTVRELGEGIADYMATRNQPWADEALMREAAIEAVRLTCEDARMQTLETIRATEVHDDRCESEWESGAMAYTPCGCGQRIR